MKKIVFLAWTIGLFISCKNEATVRVAQEDQAIITDNLSAEANMDDIDRIERVVMAENNEQLNQMKGNESFQNTFDECAEVTINRLNNNYIITIDFGNEGCVGSDGRVRTGIIESTLSGRYLTPGSTYTTVLQDYTVSGYAVTGSKSVENITGENDTNPKHSVIVSNASISFSNGTNISWESSRTRIWTEGWDTIAKLINPLDDVFSITGSYTGSNRSNLNFTGSIEEALIFKSECFFQGIRKPAAGVLVFQSERGNMSIDYGDGTCNRNITVSINGHLSSFKL